MVKRKEKERTPMGPLKQKQKRGGLGGEKGVHHPERNHTITEVREVKSTMKLGRDISRKGKMLTKNLGHLPKRPNESTLTNWPS